MAMNRGWGESRKASRASLFVKLDCQFVFTQIDKTFLAATKLTDTVLDSGTNPAVSHFHYFSPFRGILELQLIPLLSFGDLRNFWVAYEKRDCDTFRKTLEALQGKVLDHVSDPRAKEIWMDALSWAARNPEEVLVAKRHEWDSPNLIAFMTLAIENQIPATSEETLTLLREISKRAQVVRFDLDTYRKKVNEALEPIKSGELTEKQEEQARSLMRQSEAERIKRMNS